MLNADVGEGLNNEPEIFPYLDSCSIACGGHAGDMTTMQEVIRLAKQHGLKIGAHPSYPDIENFGRVSLDIPFVKLKESLLKQMDDFMTVMNQENQTISHIKAHGALYNDIARDVQKGKQYLDIFRPYKNIAALYLPVQSVVADLAKEEGFSVVLEAFMDRKYNDDLTLVSRMNPEAIIFSCDDVKAQLIQMKEKQEVVTITGNTVPIKAETFCIHGDHPQVVTILKCIDEAFSC